MLMYEQELEHKRTQQIQEHQRRMHYLLTFFFVPGVCNTPYNLAAADMVKRQTRSGKQRARTCAAIRSPPALLQQ